MSEHLTTVFGLCLLAIGFIGGAVFGWLLHGLVDDLEAGR